jgi:hypothetical protein
MSSGSHSQGTVGALHRGFRSYFRALRERARDDARPSEWAKAPTNKGNLRAGSNLSGKARETVLSYDAAAASPE